MPKVLVTGANGFIGRPLCKALSLSGWEVLGAVRRSGIVVKGAETVLIDQVGPSTDWSAALSGVEYVVHLAAKVHSMEAPSEKNAASCYSINSQGTARLAEAAAEQGVKRFLLASSVKTMTESTPPDSPLTERAGMLPTDDYGKSKLEAERSLAGICAKTDMEWLILRLPLVYGPEVKANMLRLLRLVDREVPLPFGLIRNRRSLIYIDNLVDIIVQGLSHPDAGNETFLVSDGHDLSTPELITLIASAMHRRSRLLPFPITILRVLGHLADAVSHITGRNMPVSAAAINRLSGSLAIDSSHLCRTINWNPPFSVEQGIRETVKWYLDFRD